MNITVALHMEKENLVGDEIHREELMIPDEEIYWRPYDINRFVETDYIKYKIIPYMDLLYEYEFITLEYPDNKYVKAVTLSKEYLNKE